MILKAKYIRTKNNEIVVFPELLEHKAFKHLEPISAGFINITAVEKHKTDCICYGESVGLDLKSNEIEDTKYAKWQILGYNLNEL